VPVVPVVLVVMVVPGSTVLMAIWVRKGVVVPPVVMVVLVVLAGIR
jgi:hypothetical protein